MADAIRQTQQLIDHYLPEDHLQRSLHTSPLLRYRKEAWHGNPTDFGALSSGRPGELKFPVRQACQGLTSAPHPQQTSEQLQAYLGECQHSSDGDAAWNDRHGRRPDRLIMAGVGRKETGSYGVSNGDEQTLIHGDCRWQEATLCDYSMANAATLTLTMATGGPFHIAKLGGY